MKFFWRVHHTLIAHCGFSIKFGRFGVARIAPRNIPESDYKVQLCTMFSAARATRGSTVRLSTLSRILRWALRCAMPPGTHGSYFTPRAFAEMLKFALIFEQFQKYVRRESGIAMQLAGSAETRDRYHWNRLVNAIQWYPLHASALTRKAVREFLSRLPLTAFAVVFAIVGDEAAAEDQ